MVDEDLEYLGPDQDLTRAFARKQKQRGWQVLFLERGDRISDQVIGTALEALGFDDRAPVLTSAVAGSSRVPRAGLLTTFGVDLSREVGDGRAEITVGRDEAITEALSFLMQRTPSLVAAAGASGVGKTNLLCGMARRLSEVRPDVRVVSVHLGRLIAGTLFDSERANVLSALLRQASAEPRIIPGPGTTGTARRDPPRGGSCGPGSR